MKYVDIVLLRPATLPQVIAEVMEIGLLRTATITLIITDDMLVEVDLGQKIPIILPLSIGEHEFMLKVEVYKGIIPAIIRPITKVAVVDC